jgi:hypothetical protein
MVSHSLKISILTLGLLYVAAGVASADCEADLLQLEAAIKAPSHTPEQLGVMKEAGAKASEALRKDDDAACNKFVIDALKATGASATAAEPVVASTATLGDLKTMRDIVDDTLKIVQKGDVVSAMGRIKDLETAWDKARADLKPKNPGEWDALDKSIDAVLTHLRADKPDVKASADALTALLAQFDKTK